MTNSEKKSFTSHIFKIPNTKDNFGLTRKEFDDFVVKVQGGDESLFIKVFNLHFKTSVRYIQNKFNIPEEVAYDTCMETMIEFRSKLKCGKISYGNTRFLFTKMAIHRYLDGVKRTKKVKDAINIFMESKEQMSISKLEFLRWLNLAVDRLEAPQKHMIKEIFYSGKETEQIIEENEISYSTFRKRKQRSLEKLKKNFLEILKKNQLA